MSKKTKRYLVELTKIKALGWWKKSNGRQNEPNRRDGIR